MTSFKLNILSHELVWMVSIYKQRKRERERERESERERKILDKENIRKEKILAY